ncbi:MULTISPECIES: hypothetical protein [Clostridia]|uniref:hypothetical protein n=1 Tax=Clostridia TaxID=186801 RepID=UPI001314E837|nr:MULTISPECIES: hypothetical protein [Clostridia]
MSTYLPTAMIFVPSAKREKAIPKLNIRHGKIAKKESMFYWHRSSVLLEISIDFFLSTS